jgi:hypothetical protein
MRSRQRIAEVMLPWAGLIGAGLGWGLTHQIGSNLTFDNCTLMSPLLAVVIGLFGISLAAGGAFLSLRLHRRGEAGGGGRHFLGLLGLMVPALFAAAIVWQTISSLIIPRCYG